MRRIDKALEFIGEWDDDKRHRLLQDAQDRGMSLRELFIALYCPTRFGMKCNCGFQGCFDCWLLEEGEN